MKWRERDFPRENAESIERTFSVGPLAARILAARGVTAESFDAFLSPSLKRLSKPEDLPGIAQAAEAIVDAASRGKKTVVFGDYDCDGICAAAILKKTLDAFFPGTAATFIPDRLSEGYGMSEKSICRMLSENPGVALVVTVDNGINADRHIRFLRDRGVDTIVTDHHLPGEVLPPCIVANPKVSAPEALGDLCGAGVAFMLAGAVSAAARKRGVSSPGGIAGPLVVLAGLATVADIMPLRGDNRIIVSEALRLFSRFAPPGLRELHLRASRTTPVRFGWSDFAFRLVPRINADGRLGSGMNALALLLCDDREEARRLAASVDLKNTERKTIEETMTEKALGLVSGADAADVVDMADGHAGVAGIVAARIMGSRPPGSQIPVAVVTGRRGSVRVPCGYNAVEMLSASSAALESFGGHAAAGGFLLKEGAFDEFKRLFSDAAGKFKAAAGGETGEVLFDAVVSPREITLEFAEWLERIEPCGEGNPAPVFAVEDVAVSDVRILGQTGRHVAFKLASSPSVRAVWWNGGGELEKMRKSAARTFDILFKIGISRYGESHPELSVVDIAVHSGPIRQI